MEIIKFVLSNFWIWLGAVILILAIGQAAVEVIKAVHPSRKISTYKIGDSWRIEVEGAGSGDVADAMRQINADDEKNDAPGVEL